MKARRFPRFRLTAAEKITAKILHRVYNTLSIKRKPELYAVRSFDILKTKRGKFAAQSFLVLAKELCFKKIEPTLYLKVMSEYGYFKQTKYLPPPTFLASEKAMEIFGWLEKKQRKHYTTEDEWKKGLGTNKVNEKRVLDGVINSRDHVAQIQEVTGLSINDIIFAQHRFLSPWYMALYSSHVYDDLPREEIDMIKSRARYILANKDFGKRIIETARTSR